MDSTKSITEIIKGAPKVELHVHLDGAFNTEALYKAAQLYLDDLPEEVLTPWDGKTLKVKEEIAACTDVEPFHKLVTMGPEPLGLFPMLDCFYRFLPIVRGRMDVIEGLAFDFCKQQAEHNVVYTEVRYSPHELLKQDATGKVVSGGPSADDVVAAVSKGLRRGEEAFNITVRQILCCINAQPSWSDETVNLASLHKDQGVVGVDIASGEQHFEPGASQEAHKMALETARKAGIPATVHAGEAGPPENVTKAIDVYGALRLGHGYSCIGDVAYETAKSSGAHFEVCPTSSIATVGVKSWEGHPLQQLCKDRVSCSVSTDDPAVFRTALSEELVHCIEKIGLELSDIEWMTLQGIKVAFGLNAEERTKLEAAVRTYYNEALGRQD